ncbi:peptidyl-prolyl cis-trans isomerase [Lunatibacter salilacus]|uniref:peptidyl-prolyl cis-trans isomerase n=1 Tax=Lunatibacter salilacus TaxID=2483804 RepID=UPI00293B9C52|nr:peptidyl-prolyl cis-trans isomerase [Lunatibacter salilacus]
MKVKKIESTTLQSTNLFILGFIVLFLSSCDMFKIKSEEDDDDPVVASVGKTNLHISDIDFITKDTQSNLDSAELVSRYIQTWIKKQLMIKEAGKNLTIDESELNRKLLDYRYALIIYEFEKSQVEQSLDKNVPLEEITSYYDKFKENFSLKEIIVRTNFIKMEKGLPQKRQVERLLRSTRDSDRIELKELSLRYANNYFLEDSTWIKFDDIILNTPLAQSTNNVQLLKSNKHIDIEDDNHAYFFHILEYKLQDQVPPLEFVKDEISKIIVNKRRVALAEKLHKEVYDKALENNEFEIYD